MLTDSVNMEHMKNAIIALELIFPQKMYNFRQKFFQYIIL